MHNPANKMPVTKKPARNAQAKDMKIEVVIEVQREEESGGSEAQDKIESIKVKKEYKIKSDMTVKQVSFGLSLLSVPS